MSELLDRENGLFNLCESRADNRLYVRTGSAPNVSFNLPLLSSDFETKKDLGANKLRLISKQSNSEREVSDSSYIYKNKNSDYLNPIFNSTLFSDINFEEKPQHLIPVPMPKPTQMEVNPPKQHIKNFKSSIKGILRSKSKDFSCNQNSPLILNNKSCIDVEFVKSVKIPTFGDITEDGNQTNQDASSRRVSFERFTKSEQKSEPYQVNTVFNTQPVSCNDSNNQHSFDDSEYERELERKTIEYTRKIYEKLLETDDQPTVVPNKSTDGFIRAWPNKDSSRALKSRNDSETNFNESFYSKKSQMDSKRTNETHQANIQKIFEIFGDPLKDRQLKSHRSIDLNEDKVKIKKSLDLSSQRGQHESQMQTFLFDQTSQNRRTIKRDNSFDNLKSSKYNLNRSLEKFTPRNLLKDLDQAFLNSESNRNDVNNKRNRLSVDNKQKSIPTKERSQEKQRSPSTNSPRKYISKQEGDRKSHQPKQNENKSKNLIYQTAWTTNLKQTHFSRRASLTLEDDNIYEKKMMPSAKNHNKGVQDIKPYNQPHKNELSGQNIRANCDTKSNLGIKIKAEAKSAMARLTPERKNEFGSGQETKKKDQKPLKQQIEDKINRNKQEEIRKIIFKGKITVNCSHKTIIPTCTVCSKKNPAQNQIQNRTEIKKSKV